MHEGGGTWVGSNKLVELKKKKRNFPSNCEIPRCGGHFKVLKLNRSVIKLAGDTRDVGLIPGLEGPPRVGHDNRL